MKELISKKVIFCILLLLIFFSYLIIFFTFNDYRLINYADHDEGFLLEQLILKINQFDIKQSVSSIAEYGVEYYYFKYIFVIAANFIDLNILSIFKIKVLINSFLSILGFFYLHKIFDLLNLNKIFYYILLLTIVSTPEILFLTVSLKPDLNILFYTLIMTYYFFLRSSLYNFKKDTYLFLFFLCLSLSIKAWSLPFLILIFFNKFNFLYKITFLHKIFFFLIIITIFFLLNIYSFNLKNFILSDDSFSSFYLDNSKHFILNIAYTLINKYFLLSILILNLILILLFYYCLQNGKYKNFTIKIVLFFCLWFIIWYPYISDFNTFLKTIIEHSYATTLNVNSDSYKTYENIILYTWYDIKDFKINFSILIIFLLSPILIYIDKKKFSQLKVNIISLYLLSLVMYLFVNLISNYPNQYPAKYLYFIFMNIYVFYFLNFYLINKKYKKIIFLILFLPLILNFTSNFYKYFDFINYSSLGNEIKKVVKDHDKKIDFKNKNLILCSSSYPINYYKKKFENVTSKLSSECFDPNFISKVMNNDIIFFENKVLSRNNTNLFLKNFDLFYNDKIIISGRFGRKEPKLHFFYKKK